jgi:quinol monooxygenase YgiN
LIHVIATVELQPGTRAKFLREFAVLKPQVVTEDGCIEYGAAIDVESGLGPQAPFRADAVIIVEKWTSLDTLKTHLTAPHMKAYREGVKDYVRGTILQVLSPVD